MATKKTSKRSKAAASRSAVSLADVARRARVAPSTVSRALSGDKHHRMREDTRAHIVEVARTLGYHPNLVARGLRTARSYSLGIIVPQLDNPVYGQMITGAEAAAREHGYALLIVRVGQHEDGAQAVERLARMNRVDGILIASLDDGAILAPALKRANVPCVVLNRRAAGVVNCVLLDTRLGAALAVRHLVQLGHCRIAHLAGLPGGSGAEDRMAGYRDTLAESGIRFDARMVEVGGYTAEGGERAMRDVLRRVNPPPTAVFAATMMSAAGAMKAMRATGLVMPRDISIVALHDGMLAEMLEPPLTTVRLPTQEMGYEAARGLVDLIEGRVVRVARVLPPRELAVRSSTAPPRN